MSVTRTEEYGNKLPSKKVELLVVQCLLIAFAFVIVGLRLLTRFYIVRRPGWDDYTIVFATVRWPIQI